MNLKLVYRLFSLLLFAPMLVFASPDYVGGERCESCHEVEYQAWQGSHHQLAMQEANEQSVLGNFENQSFSKDGIKSTFFKDQQRFMINTDGPDGKLQDYQIDYVFGVYPLQQYMVKFPQGRVQVLDIAWDSRPMDEGGQRWFSLHPDEQVPAGDVLHWTGPNLNWNYMCADCHSTDLRKLYDPDTETYQTSWKDIHVSCEACHGPGSEHITWAETTAAGENSTATNRGLTVSLDERVGVHWQFEGDDARPVRSQPNDSRAEINVCARCHSRRSQLSDDFIPGQLFMEAYHPALLNDGLYHADGQMLDEVYVWGSFRQSKMYHAGVSCSDCHDPHKADLKQPGEQVCYQCHLADRYATEEHHFHEPATAGASCVECHMPPTVFMGVDPRHEHAFRVPRPDISISQGTPNACNQCHTEQTAQWSLEQIKQRLGRWPQGSQEYAGTLNAARNGGLGAAALLQRLAMDTEQPAIARATAYGYLGGAPNQTSMMLLQQGLNDPDPLIRQGALTAVETLPVQHRLIALPAVWDEVRSVRIQAARLMAASPRDQIGPERSAKVDAVLEEYIQTQLFNGERPEAQLNLAGLYTELEQFTEAELAFRTALRLQPKFIPAYINFAQMLSDRGRETEAANLLEAGLEDNPDSADLYHAFGLSKVRQKDLPAAVQNLAKAASFAPGSSRYQYVYAVALQSTGQLGEAVTILQRAAQRFPADLEILYTLLNFSREAGQADLALQSALKLQALVPGNAEIDKLVESLQP